MMVIFKEVISLKRNRQNSLLYNVLRAIGAGAPLGHLWNNFLIDRRRVLRHGAAAGRQGDRAARRQGDRAARRAQSFVRYYILNWNLNILILTVPLVTFRLRIYFINMRFYWHYTYIKTYVFVEVRNSGKKDLLKKIELTVCHTSH